MSPMYHYNTWDSLFLVLSKKKKRLQHKQPYNYPIFLLILFIGVNLTPYILSVSFF